MACCPGCWGSGVSYGSLNELETQLELAQRIGFLAQGLHEGLSTELAVLGRQLNALKNNIKD